MISTLPDKYVPNICSSKPWAHATRDKPNYTPSHHILPFQELAASGLLDITLSFHFDSHLEVNFSYDLFFSSTV